MKRLLLVGAVASLLVAAVAYAQTRCGSNLCVGGTSTPVVLEGSGERAMSGRPTSGSFGLHCEVGTATLAAGTVAVTFARAFAAAPFCVASDTNASAAAANANGATTTGVTLKGTTTDVLNYICCGSR